MKAITVSEAITSLLEQQGDGGAFLKELYPAVNSALGRDVPKASVRATIYNRLVGAKGAYLPRYERFHVNDQSKYRLLESRVSKI